MTLALFALILTSVSLNAFAQIALRKAMLVAGPLPSLDQPVALVMHLVTNLYLWGGMACYGLSIGLWLAVLAKAPVSVAYPMLSMGYVIAAVSGVLLLGESVNLMRAGGIGLICVGVLFVARSANA
jgi:multidrug transporter EmrE-like cation transporter